MGIESLGGNIADVVASAIVQVCGLIVTLTGPLIDYAQHWPPTLQVTLNGCDVAITP
ncbi:MAG: hypothetical protein Q8R84_03220 [Candidatus Nitrotoga sp.]|nr:hypothetical protein [Candidatus Nitrotoga sp.]